MFYFLKGGQLYPFPPCLPQWLPSMQSLVLTCSFLGTSLSIPVMDLAVCSRASKELGWGGCFARD